MEVEMKKNYLNPQELARLWNMNEKTVRKLINEMREIGDWNDQMVKPLRTVLVTDEAFEEYLSWRAEHGQG
jgi:hypothetical protein